MDLLDFARGPALQVAAYILVAGVLWRLVGILLLKEKPEFSEPRKAGGLMAALKMFELGKLSSGKAAELAGMSRVEFFEMCGRYRVPVFNYPDQDVETELLADVAVTTD